MSERIPLELCRRHDNAPRFERAAVIERFVVDSREEADRLIAEQRPNDFFVREQPEDRTGN